MRTLDVPPELEGGSPEVLARRRGAVDHLLVAAGAVLLMCAAVLPGFARLILLPALLLAPGYALLSLLGQSAGRRPVSMAVPVSLVLIITASLVLYVSGIRLGPASLGLSLGAVTALFLAGFCGRQLIDHRSGQHRRPLPADGKLVREPATFADPRFLP